MCVMEFDSANKQNLPNQENVEDLFNYLEVK